MSRKFIDDHVELLDTRTRLPGSSNTAFLPGHMFRDSITGARYVNQGVGLENAIFGRSLSNRYELVETFQRAPLVNASIGVAANLDWEVVGTNAANAGSTFAAGGGVTLTTAGADGDQQIATPHLDTKQSGWAGTNWNTSDRVVLETSIKTGASIASAVIWFGLKLTNTSVTATDNNQVFLRYEDDVNSGKFQFVTSRAGTDTATDTGLAVAVSTEYNIRIVIDGDRIPYLFINGIRYATGLAALTADVDLIPYIGVEADGATAAKTIICRGVAASKDLND